MSERIKRWKVQYMCNVYDDPIQCDPTLECDSNGPWVKYTDHQKEISQLKAENELLKTKLTELEESCVTLIRVCKWCKSEYTGPCCKNCEQEAGEV